MGPTAPPVGNIAKYHLVTGTALIGHPSQSDDTRTFPMNDTIGAGNGRFAENCIPISRDLLNKYSGKFSHKINPFM